MYIIYANKNMYFKKYIDLTHWSVHIF